MSTVRTIAKNAIVLAVARVLTVVLGMVLTIFIARFIRDVGYGKLSFAQSFTVLLVAFADIGLSRVTIREIARKKELASKYIGNILFIKLILSVVTFALIALIINLMHYPADTTIVVYLIGISSILNSFSTFLRAIFRAFERMEFEAILNIGKHIITTGVGLTVLFSGYGLIAIAFVYLLSSFVDLFASLLVMVKKIVKPKLEVDFRFWKQIIILALPFLSGLIGMIYVKIDIIMLSAMKGDAPVGWYVAACNIVYNLVIIPDVFSYALFPVMSKLYVSSKDALKATLEKAVKYLFIIGLPIATGAILLADKIILLFYGQGFSHSIIVLQILSLYLPFRFINHVTGDTLSSINKQPLRALSVIITATSDVILNLCLISKFSFIGASVATVIAQIVLFVCYYYFVTKHFHRLPLDKILPKPCLACLGMIVFIFCLRGINLALLIVLSIILYFSVLYILKGFDSLDKAMFKDLMEGVGGVVRLQINQREVK